MKYAVISVINGNYKIEAEGFDSLNSAKVFFAGKWQTLLNASDVITGCVMIANEYMECVEGKKEIITHEANELQP